MILFADFSEPCARFRRIFSWRQIAVIAVSGRPFLNPHKGAWRDFSALKFHQKLTFLWSNFWRRLFFIGKFLDSFKKAVWWSKLYQFAEFLVRSTLWAPGDFSLAPADAAVLGVKLCQSNLHVGNQGILLDLWEQLPKPYPWRSKSIASSSN